MQGTLYGLQVKFLPIILRHSGSTLTYIGSLQFAAFPWLLKPLWAPLIGRYWNRTHWLAITLTGIGCCLAAAVTCEDHLLGTVLLLLNIFTSTLEIVLGKITILETESCHIAKGSALQILSYKLGMLNGGGILLWIANYINRTKEICSALSLVYFTSVLWILWPTFCRNCEQQKLVQPAEVAIKLSERSSISSHSRNDVIKVLHGLWSSSRFKWSLVCAMVYKFPSHSSQTLFTMFLVDHGAGVGKIGILFGVVGQVISLVVSAVTSFAHIRSG